MSQFKERMYKPVTSDSITISDTAGGITLTAATLPQKSLVDISVETAQIRFTTDGTAPTTTVGHLANPGDIIVLDNQEEIINFKAIRATATSATIRATYYR